MKTASPEPCANWCRQILTDLCREPSSRMILRCCAYITLDSCYQETPRVFSQIRLNHKKGAPRGTYTIHVRVERDGTVNMTQATVYITIK